MAMSGGLAQFFTVAAALELLLSNEVKSCEHGESTGVVGAAVEAASVKTLALPQAVINKAAIQIIKLSIKIERTFFILNNIRLFRKLLCKLLTSKIIT